jgi:hypothetical protein
MIPRVVNKARTFAEAEGWDIAQHLRMTPDERRRVARELRRRFYYIGLAELIRDKASCGREKDLDDSRYLRRIGA